MENIICANVEIKVIDMLTKLLMTKKENWKARPEDYTRQENM